MIVSAWNHGCIGKIKLATEKVQTRQFSKQRGSAMLPLCQFAPQICSFLFKPLNQMISLTAIMLDTTRTISCRLTSRLQLKRCINLSKGLTLSQCLMFLIIGLFGGTAPGLFGVGGGIIIVPALIYRLVFHNTRQRGPALHYYCLQTTRLVMIA